MGLFGRARDLRDPKVFHQISLVAFLAWVGLGADGLSSSAYGPEEAFKALGHSEGCYGGRRACSRADSLPRGVPRGRDRRDRVHHLVGLPPHHRGVPARRRRLHRRDASTSGPYVGAVSGCALLVDYVLTIAISLAVGRRRGVQLPARELAAVQARDRARRARDPDADEPARRQGVGHDPDADLPRLPASPTRS